jgi:hypothetical protein
MTPRTCRWPLLAALSLILPIALIAQSPVPDTLSWETISPGVQYAVAGNAIGDGVFIGFGGWTVQQPWANTWVAALYTAKLHSLGVRHLYSVKGPLDSQYFDREIGTLDLGRNLIALLKSNPGITRIIVAAHSSGAYVAQALFEDLYTAAKIDSDHVTDGKITYFNLEGGIGSGGSGVEITQTMADRLAHIYAVYASIPALKLSSPNMTEMIALGNLFAPKSSAMQINVTGCGCTGTWCVHETLINQIPYNHSTFDLQHDYGSINAEHPVATAYLYVITSVVLPPPKPEGFLLEQNFPNPFNPATLIGYTIPGSRENGIGSKEVKLVVYDILGREVAVPVNGRKTPGRYEVEFDGTGLSSGTYVYRLTAGQFNGSRTMLLVR